MEALESILEVVQEHDLNLKIEKMTKEELETLLQTYGTCIIYYHPEANHQERAALLREFEMLEKYGMTEDYYDAIDFS